MEYMGNMSRITSDNNKKRRERIRAYCKTTREQNECKKEINTINKQREEWNKSKLLEFFLDTNKFRWQNYLQ